MPEVKKSPLALFISNQVKKRRLEKGWSQAVLAVKLEVSDAFIGQTELPHYRTKYNLEHLYKLAIIFHCKVQDFLPEEVL